MNNTAPQKIGVQEMSGEEVMSQLERESAYRRLEGPMAKVVFLLTVCWSLFQLYTALFGTFPSTLQRAPHVGAALVLIFLLYPIRKNMAGNRIPWYDYLLSAAGFVVSFYHILFFDELQLRSGMFTKMDVAVSIAAVLLILEATRRVAGPVIVCLASAFLLYAYFGAYFPGFLAHPGLSVRRIATFEWLGTEGILGSPIYVSSTFIFLFLLFATFLGKSGVGDWMTGVAMGTCGGVVGGPAKAAVIASALEGTVSGSSVANTVGSGSVTIPLMKKIGYRSEFAGAVEAAASTGGQIMPPIMGAAAFIMTEYIGCTYLTVALAACIPALLYFTGIFTNVHFEALKCGLRGLTKEEMPDWKGLLKRGWYMILPLVLITVMLTLGFTAMRAALFGIIACLAVWVIEISRDANDRFRPLDFLSRFILALSEGARSALAVAITCASAGIIVGVITLSGLGLKLAGGIVDLAGENLLLTMLLTMCCSLVLGMGVPTTANYIIQATISAPAMIALGVEPIAAHLFVFYFGIIADITPPVALAAFAGAGIAGSNPMKTGFEAFRLGFAAYLVPFIFVLSPELVLVRPEGVSTLLFVAMIIKAIITAVVGMVGVATCLSGYFLVPCRIWERAVLFAGGVLLIHPGTLSDVTGITLLAVVYFCQRVRRKKCGAEKKVHMPDSVQHPLESQNAEATTR